MIKKIFFLIIILITVSSFSQKQKATLFFRDGTTLEGLASLIPNGDKIKFKKDKEAKSIYLNYKKINKIIIEEDGVDIAYHYKIINDLNRPPVLLNYLEINNLILYVDKKEVTAANPIIDTTYNQHNNFRNPFFTKNETISPFTKNEMILPFKKQMSIQHVYYYYYSKKNDDFVDFLTTSDIFTLEKKDFVESMTSSTRLKGRKKKIKKFKKLLSNLFENCPQLIDTYSSKQFFVEKDLFEIVEFYNKNCLESSN